MADRPKEFPFWAMIDRRNEITGQNNVLPPPEEKMLLGWNFKEQPARNWLNYLFRTICQWLQYFDDKITTIENESGAGNQQINERIATLETDLSIEQDRVDNANAAIGQLEERIDNLPTGGSGNSGSDDLVVVKTVGAGHAIISEHVCSFRIQAYNKCGVKGYCEISGHRTNGSFHHIVHEQMGDIIPGAPTMLGDGLYFPIANHAVNDLIINITMIKGA